MGPALIILHPPVMLSQASGPRALAGKSVTQGVLGQERGTAQTSPQPAQTEEWEALVLVPFCPSTTHLGFLL